MIDLITFEHDGPCCETCLQDVADRPDLKLSDECCCRGIRTDYQNGN